MELWVLSAVVTLALVGLAASLLAVFGIFDRIALALSGATLAAVIWPWERSQETPRSRARTRWLEIAMLLLLCGGTLALRWPAMDYPARRPRPGHVHAARRVDARHRRPRLSRSDPRRSDRGPGHASRTRRRPRPLPAQHRSGSPRALRGCLPPRLVSRRPRPRSHRAAVPPPAPRPARHLRRRRRTARADRHGPRRGGPVRGRDLLPGPASVPQCRPRHPRRRPARPQSAGDLGAAQRPDGDRHRLVLLGGLPRRRPHP